MHHPTPATPSTSIQLALTFPCRLPDPPPPPSCARSCVCVPAQESLAAYWIFGLHWGRAVPQNKKGHLIGHIKDIGHDASNPNTRLYATNVAQPWHNDGPADLVCECMPAPHALVASAAAPRAPAGPAGLAAMWGPACLLKRIARRPPVPPF